MQEDMVCNQQLLQTRTRVCILQQSANPRSAYLLICCIAFWERAVSHILGSFRQARLLGPFCTCFRVYDRKARGYLIIYLFTSLISIACTRAYVVDHCLQRCMGHYSIYVVYIYNEIVFDCAIEKCKTEAFINISICNWRLPFLSLNTL